MGLADLLEPGEQPCRIGIDSIDLGGLVGNRNLDQLVQLLVDAALEQRDQRRPGDVGPPAAAKLLDLGELVEGVLELGLDGGKPVHLCRLHPPFIGGHESKLRLGQALQLVEIGFDHLMEIGRAERAVADAGQQRIGPGLEQLLAVAGQLKLPLELLMGDAGAAEEGMGFGDPPIGKAGRRQGHGEQQPSCDQKLGLVAHVVS